MSEEKKAFTIKDRRHFTAEGLAREEAPEVEGPPPAAPQVDPVPRSAPAVSRGPGAEGPPHADFAGFLLSLAAQASLTFTGQGESREPDLSEARHFISLFEMLKDKTEGRRTPEEDQILQGILYELRLAFVARARPGGA
jgi:hypothetical protein